MASDPRLATLIGDVVGSKRHADREDLQLSLSQALNAINQFLRPPQPLEPTIGDEFQGGFSTIAAAVRASLLLRLELLARAEVDSRYGLGFGEVTVFQEARSPTSQDGPGWWSARTAIERVKSLAGSPRTSYVRTSFEGWDSEGGPPHGEAAAVDALLICRDATVERMNPRGRRLLLGLLLGRPQAELASEEAITQSAVSQNLARSGAYAIEVAQRRLEERPA